MDRVSRPPRTAPMFLCLAFLICLVSGENADPLIKVVNDGKLLPDQTLTRQTLVFGYTKTYEIKEIKENTNYEIRVSYPAYQPTAFELNLVVNQDNRNSGSPASRRLLNIEKITFTTDDEGNIKGEAPLISGQQYLVVVSAKPEGVQPTDADTSFDFVEFDIVLETMFIAVPFDVLKLAILLAAIGLLAFILHRLQAYSKFTSLMGAPPLLDPALQAHNIGKVL